MVILDTSKDWRFASNPLVEGGPKIRFYAGAPIVTSEGYVVGVFAIADPNPREEFKAPSRRGLMDFARTTMMEIEIILSEMEPKQKDIPSINFPEDAKRGNGSKSSIGSGKDGRRDSYLSVHSVRAVSESATMQFSRASTLIGAFPMPANNSPSLQRSASVSSCVSFTKEAPLSQAQPRGEVPKSPVSPLVPSPSSEPAQARSARSRRRVTPSNSTGGGSSIRSSSSRPAMSGPSISQLIETNYALSVMAYSLDFDLVYLLRVRPRSPFLTEEFLHGDNLYTKVLASFGMPTPEPTFDAELHLKALRSEEGIIYANTNPPDSDDVGFRVGILLPLVQDRGRKNSAVTTSTDGTLVEGFGCRSGIVLGAFSGKDKDVDERMLCKIKEFGRGMREVLLRVDGYIDGGMLY